VKDVVPREQWPYSFSHLGLPLIRDNVKAVVVALDNMTLADRNVAAEMIKARI
jgi:hypothetical protein